MGGSYSDGETAEEQLPEVLSCNKVLAMQNQTLSKTVYPLCTKMSDLAKRLERETEEYKEM